MSKGILEFSLPEEREEFDLALKAPDLYSTLWDFSEILRQKMKYDNLPEPEYRIVRGIREILFSLLEERGFRYYKNLLKEQPWR